MREIYKYGINLMMKHHTVLCYTTSPKLKDYLKSLDKQLHTEQAVLALIMLFARNDILINLVPKEALVGYPSYPGTSRALVSLCQKHKNLQHLIPAIEATTKADQSVLNQTLYG